MPVLHSVEVFLVILLSVTATTSIFVLVYFKSYSKSSKFLVREQFSYGT